MTTLVIVFSFNNHKTDLLSKKKGQLLKKGTHIKLKRVGVGSQISSMNVVDMVGAMLLYVLVVVV